MTITDLLTEVEASASLPSPERCRAIRVGANVSLARLAAAIGVSVQALQHWEVGKRRPRPANVLRYAHALDALAAASKNGATVGSGDAVRSAEGDGHAERYRI